jgi:hypothetical protein
MSGPPARDFLWGGLDHDDLGVDGGADGDNDPPSDMMVQAPRGRHRNERDRDGGSSG